MAGWKPNPAASPDQRLVAIETMMCEALNRLFGNGQKGELDRMQDETRQLDRRITEIEQASEKRAGASEEKGNGQARFYTRAGLVFGAFEVAIHGLGWAKDMLLILLSGGRHAG